MNTAPDADTRSPWYEAFTPEEDMPEMVWLPGTQFPASADEAEAATGGGAEDQWATEALFDCYNG